jgi:hypothetical protein
MMQTGLLLRLCGLISGIVATSLWGFTAAQARPTFPQATVETRVRQRQERLERIVPAEYDLRRFPMTDAYEGYWRELLWTTAVVEPQEPFVDETVSTMIRQSTGPVLTAAQERLVKGAMQVGTQLYLSEPTAYPQIAAALAQTLEQSQKSEWVAMALSALARASNSEAQLQQWRDHTRQRFPQWQTDPHLYTTLRDLQELDTAAPLPPLADLLAWTIAPGEAQMYVFCRPDRGVLCRAVVRDGDGEFLKRYGELWSVPLLLRSLHHLPWNFTRGETPQGIYRIEGTRAPDLSVFRAYGQFPLVMLFVPYEAGVEAFLPQQPGTLQGGLTAYQTLLPPTWRDYFPIQQTYWAGRLGRSLFRIHGSGEDPGFFTNNADFPASAGWNPSIGCLTALELYDAQGRLVRADMPDILNALVVASGRADFSGYLTVVDVPGGSEPVSLEQIETAIANFSNF